MIRHFILSLVLLSSCLSTHAQEGNEIGGWLGLSQYFGDLNTSNSINSPGLAAGLIARHNFNERISIAGNLGFGRLSSADSLSTNSYQKKRNLSFRSNVWDISGVLEFNFFPYIHGSYDHYYTPYIFGGIGVSKFNPQGNLNGTWYNLRDLGTEGQNLGDEYQTSAMTLVYGGGFKIDLNRDFSLNIAISGRKLMSDYLDDVSEQYPDLSTLSARRGVIATQLSDRSGDPDFAREGFQRGNQRDNDYYYFLSIGIVKYFSDIKCPDISKISIK